MPDLGKRNRNSPDRLSFCDITPYIKMKNYLVHFFEPTEGVACKSVHAFDATQAEVAIKTLYPNATGISTRSHIRAEVAEDDHVRASFGVSYLEEEYIKGRASGHISASPSEKIIYNWYVEWHREHPEGGNPALPTALASQFSRSTTTPMSIASSLTVSDGQSSPIPMAAF